MVKDASERGLEEIQIKPSAMMLLTTSDLFRGILDSASFTTVVVTYMCIFAVTDT